MKAKHLFYYLSLACLLAIGFIMPVYFTGQKTVQLSFIVLTALLYVIWGVSHHILHHSFSIKIMLEYIAIAILGVAIIFFAFNVAL